MVRHKAISKAVRLRTSYVHVLELCLYSNVFVYGVFTGESGTRDFEITGTLDTTCRCLVENCGLTVASSFQMNSEGKMAESLGWDVWVKKPSFSRGN